MKSKVWVKLSVIGAIALAVAGGVAALVILVFIPAGKYNSANSLRENGDPAGAYDLFDRLGDYRDAAAQKEAMQADVIQSRSAETMDFGGHQWLVLEERDGKALLLLQEVLDPIAYNETFEATSWETCTLRIYLNGSFYNRIPEEDRARIAETAVINSDNAENGTKAGSGTKDHVFLLSLAEAKLYFPTQASRVGRGSKGATMHWWLRSPGMEPSLAATVISDGALGYAGSGVHYLTRGVRPAIWIAME